MEAREFGPLFQRLGRQAASGSRIKVTVHAVQGNTVIKGTYRVRSVVTILAETSAILLSLRMKDRPFPLDWRRSNILRFDIKRMETKRRRKAIVRSLENIQATPIVKCTLVRKGKQV